MLYHVSDSRDCCAGGLGHGADAMSGPGAGDEFTVPLCRGHHREVHRCGDEAAWWNKLGIEPAVSARALWLQTHPLPTSSDTSASDG
jgi:hypothetical protein